MPDRISFQNITLVLHRPRIPENIGAVARAMRNMGLERLTVVAPENFDLKRALMMSTHVAADIVENMTTSRDLKSALSACGYVVGTTARLGRQRQVIQSPRKLAKTLVPISAGNQVAILFGPEDKGLSNEDIRFCHALVNIPTAEFSSLNLAQAAMVICYELFLANAEEGQLHSPRLATRHELDGMYEQLREVLVRISFINPENPDYWMNNLRRFFTRMQLRAREVRIIRGVCRQINWYGNKCYEDGRKGIFKDGKK